MLGAVGLLLPLVVVVGFFIEFPVPEELPDELDEPPPGFTTLFPEELPVPPGFTTLLLEDPEELEVPPGLLDLDDPPNGLFVLVVTPGVPPGLLVLEVPPGLLELDDPPSGLLVLVPGLLVIPPGLLVLVPGLIPTLVPGFETPMEGFFIGLFIGGFFIGTLNFA